MGICIHAQDSLYINPSVLPNHEYLKESRNTFEGTMHFDGSEELMHAFEEEEVNKTMQLKSIDITITHISTNELNDNNEIPAVMQLKNLTITLNQMNEQQLTENPINGKKIYGKFLEGKFAYDSIQDQNSPPMDERELKEYLKGFQNA